VLTTFFASLRVEIIFFCFNFAAGFFPFLFRFELFVSFPFCFDSSFSFNCKEKNKHCNCEKNYSNLWLGSDTFAVAGVSTSVAVPDVFVVFSAADNPAVPQSLEYLL
jgi:hypothetical protein